MIRKQIFIDARQNGALKRFAEETGRSEGQLIREAVDRWLADQEEKAQLWEALLDRWRLEAGVGARTWKRDDLYHDRLRKFDAGY